MYLALLALPTTSPLLVVTLIIVGYLFSVRYFRYTWQRETEDMPLARYRAMGRLVALYDMPTISRTASTFGFFIPTPFPEFKINGQKRYDDTELLLAEMVERCVEVGRSEAAIARLNVIHGAYNISDDDYLFTLTLFVVPAVQWVARWGWRPFTAKEADAIALAWSELGANMGMPAHRLPLDYAGYLQMFNEYTSPDSPHYRIRPSAAGAAVTRDSLETVYTWVPAAVVPLLRPALTWLIRGCLPSDVTAAIGLAPAGPTHRALISGFLHLRAFIIRHACLPRPSWWPYVVTSGKVLPSGARAAPCSRSYRATGYCIGSLGPAKFAAAPTSEAHPPTIHAANVAAWMARRDAHYGW
ncbi:uncharacterized protein AMSG_05536 [Thecamonas trahens ATCC 50062]|uniref:ER-bound oxygenase mpaB/mpaB'/Rubber oxygenase catalytic domain-containing protein n=1 Tax=Thecamonas trahens ATCC 50062 TaxID=461836 RepID=A0A0L0DB87_THETB|nr:hypothetical protein AMSG_05536 [Thecamonas trahens ATCC 50062]KNC49515.1 hypothetical protein AMSG_05536 [Thecamonas trahens ATCC 50062]|eukprot:XP_013757631.1 hypothetical protein AMSG_05536 [Thecamonas trahens ATCC 50062]